MGRRAPRAWRALWFLERFAAQAVEPELIDGKVSPNDTVAAAVERYRATSARVDAVVAAADLDDICVCVDEELNPDLRWVLAHALEETARHAGALVLRDRRAENATERTGPGGRRRRAR